MDHEYYRDRVSAYHDQGLTPEETRMMQEHLEECEECRTLLEQFKRLDRLVEANSGLDGDDYWEKAAQKIDRAIAGEDEQAEITDIRPARSGFVWKVAAVAASVAVLTFIGLNKDQIFEGQDIVAPTLSETEPLKTLAIPTDTVAAAEESTESVDQDATGRGAGMTASQPEPSGDKETVTSSSTETPVRSDQETTSTAPAPVEKSGAEAEKKAETDQTVADQLVTVRGGRAGEGEYMVEGVRQVPKAQSSGDTGAAALSKDKGNRAPRMAQSASQPSRGETSQSATSVVDLLKLTDSGPVAMMAEDEVGPNEFDLRMDSLNFWRDRRDAYTEALKYADYLDRKESYAAGAKAEKPVGKATGDQPADSATWEESVTLGRLHLVEAWYEIARLTTDSVEFRQALAYLESVSKGLDKTARDKAREYLELLPDKPGD